MPNQGKKPKGGRLASDTQKLFARSPPPPSMSPGPYLFVGKPPHRKGRWGTENPFYVWGTATPPKIKKNKGHRGFFPFSGKILCPKFRPPPPSSFSGKTFFLPTRPRGGSRFSPPPPNTSHRFRIKTPNGENPPTRKHRLVFF